MTLRVKSKRELKNDTMSTSPVFLYCLLGRCILLLFSVKARLLQMGHLEKDMGDLRNLPAVGKDSELTDRSMFMSGCSRVSVLT
jgi:hypothetical protein